MAPNKKAQKHSKNTLAKKIIIKMARKAKK